MIEATDEEAYAVMREREKKIEAELRENQNNESLVRKLYLLREYQS